MPERLELDGLRGPLTAHQALNAVLPAVRQVDTEFQLTFVASQEGIDPDGRAYAWDFFFDFPRRREQGVFYIHLCPGDDDDEGPWCLDPKVRPITMPARTKMVPPPAKPILPLEFRDSADAARALAEQGADFVSGDSHMTLSSTVLPSGEIVWQTTCWDKVYQTPFA